MSARACSLCRDPCAIIPVPRPGRPLRPAPARELADGKARRVKFSAYSLHHHRGHRAGAGRLESSLRGRSRPQQCHLQGTFPPRSQGTSHGDSRGCRAVRGCGPALYWTVGSGGWPGQPERRPRSLAPPAAGAASWQGNQGGSEGSFSKETYISLAHTFFCRDLGVRPSPFMTLGSRHLAGSIHEQWLSPSAQHNSGTCWGHCSAHMQGELYGGSVCG